MNKTELVDKIAEKTGLEKTKISSVVNALLDTIIETLISGDSVALIGFANFKSRKREARSGVNPQTRKAMTIPAKIVPLVTFGEVIKKAVESGTFDGYFFKPKSTLSSDAPKKKK